MPWKSSELAMVEKENGGAVENKASFLGTLY